MTDRRSEIIDAGLAIVREQGFTGLTQPRVAARAGLKASHLTYYYPTRVDLLTAIARTAVDRQLFAVKALFNALKSIDQAAMAIADLITRHDNTRVLMALAQAGDQAPKIRTMFCELADGIATEIDAFLARVSNRPPAAHAARLLHAASVGLAVVTLATGRTDGREDVASMLRDLLTTLL
ncbi:MULTISPECIES: TetR family transcriptional regulator [unclassified Caballeronia]|uniref:TetR/AcrR family transcriptional regulator n=1 Tax=unclassified Caballeronia TaxID=2646786 RepID=UPI002866F1B4|nr:MULTISPECIES: TetR family transcriptional regulator [unclassified Caballeronia]MDR5777079.1 TetR family transcriptional regulator [Caballeronia sp. LZ002]MDR5798632.1 TetR family transcriptional regulator [Caballeronia sp. LZ001]MDR5852477.1 TetR family transcriptional regulator [Caballeronia sp. LZ003]